MPCLTHSIVFRIITPKKKSKKLPQTVPDNYVRFASFRYLNIHHRQLIAQSYFIYLLRTELYLRPCGSRPIEFGSECRRRRLQHCCVTDQRRKITETGTGRGRRPALGGSSSNKVATWSSGLPYAAGGYRFCVWGRRVNSKGKQGIAWDLGLMFGMVREDGFLGILMLLDWVCSVW